ncbi:DUF2628 domain-containing protein [Lacrimispora sp.]|uniref:DUF2628 domain-containing protein n=1 Tax=Lacrimispora sp. TaxID=2719234 RepID=UPI0028B1FC1C|nr:DUF2628 domain-containing protein [Lacrimispora sp.]
MEKELQSRDDWEMELFVGEKYYYYKKQWQDRNPSQSFTSWNWVAFFFPFYWLLARKMYRNAFIVFLVSIFAWIIPFGGLAIHIILALYANYFYYQKYNLTKQAVQGYLKGEAEEYLKKHGGTNIPAVFITVFILLCIVCIGIGVLIFVAGSKENKASATVGSTYEVSSVGESTYEGSSIGESAHEVASSGESTYEITTKGNELTYTIPTYLTQKNDSESDLYLVSASGTQIVMITLYNIDDFSELIDEQYFIDAVSENLVSSDDITEIKEVSDAVLLPLDSQTPQMLYSLIEEGSVFYDYITCTKIGDFYALTNVVIRPSQWEKDKQHIADIILSAKEPNHS